MRLIDADALLIQIEEDAKNIGPGQYGDEWRFIGTIENAPTIDPVKHGRWIPINSYPYEKCSVCGETHDTVGCLDNYCPNCGARMDGDDNAVD